MWDQARDIRLLRLDVATTIGPGYDEVVTDTALRISALVDTPEEHLQRLVDEVQQYFHDTFVDTSWPRCPEHPNHPLWFGGGWWRCERTHRSIAKLGELGQNRVNAG